VDEANHSDGGSTERMAGLGGAVLDHEALRDLLQGVVLLARQSVAGADSVSITVADGDRYRTTNSTAEEALAIDEAQYEGDDGPCLAALRSTRQIQVTVGADTGRWPVFEARARESGVTSVLSSPLLRPPGGAVGALNIYGHGDGGFDDVESHTAQVIAEHAAILVANASALSGAVRVNEELRHAVASREIIGEAKGIIMERQKCTRDQAFEILRRASQRENRKLRELAEELVLRVEARGNGGPAKQ